MPRLFIDVDDTLIKWNGKFDQHPFGHGAESWEVNMSVINAIKVWRESHPDGQVVIWSGGGQDYAKTWRNRVIDRLIPGLQTETMSKMPSLTRFSDTIIDDQRMPGFNGKYIHPRELASEEAADAG